MIFLVSSLPHKIITKARVESWKCAKNVNKANVVLFCLEVLKICEYVFRAMQLAWKRKLKIRQRTITIK